MAESSPGSDAEVIAASGLFDEEFYSGAAEADAMGVSSIEHYLMKGEAAGLAPSRLFDPDFYRQRYPDIGTAGISPLVHFICRGRAEGRTARSAASSLSFPVGRRDRETVVVAVHEASRTGAPIIAWNIVRELQARYDVVALLKSSGPLQQAFEAIASATVILPEGIVWDEAETRALARHIVEAYAPQYLVANSVETRYFVPAFEQAGVPTIVLVHEFSSTVRPHGSLSQLFREATEIVFPAQMVADAALADYRTLAARPYKILPQGPCRSPAEAAPREARRPQWSEPSFDDGQGSDLPARDGSVVVLGMGTITPRKGVEFFVAAAARVARHRTAHRIVFAWAGQCYWFDEAYREALEEQIARSGLAGSFLFLGELDDPAPIYSRADIFFLSSRLDPMPNVAIDAAVHGIPLVCFEQASGMAERLAGLEDTQELVVPYLDAAAAADRILELAEDPDRRAAAALAMRSIVAEQFDMARYVGQIDALGRAAARASAQMAWSREIVEAEKTFNASLYAGVLVTASESSKELDSYLNASRRVAPRNRPGAGLLLRRPLEGFHPLIYAGENASFIEASGEDPLAHFARTGYPDGRWRHDVIRPDPRVGRSKLRVAVHGHFHYPEFLSDFLERLRRNKTEVDLILTTTSDASADEMAGVLGALNVSRARIMVVPNRGRDIGPMLTSLGHGELGKYDVVGHVHGKRSPHVNTAIGERWRNFLWEHLVGGEHAMVDTVLAAFGSDDGLGLVFPEDPHLNDWDGNRSIAKQLAEEMGLPASFPNHFDFPLGTMFWARPAALSRLFDLGLGWDRYPSEPIPIDGTLLHALERILPFVAAHAGFRYATTYVHTVRR